MELKKQDVGVLVNHFREVIFVANRMRDNYAEGDEKVKRTLWTDLHTKADAARDFYEDNKEWLKPIEQVYVLTEDELAVTLASFAGNNINIAKIFISSITE